MKTALTNLSLGSIAIATFGFSFVFLPLTDHKALGVVLYLAIAWMIINYYEVKK